jgi:hypothetical protein
MTLQVCGYLVETPYLSLRAGYSAEEMSVQLSDEAAKHASLIVIKPDFGQILRRCLRRMESYDLEPIEV